MTTWSEVEGEDIEDRITIRARENRLYSGDTRRRCHAACYNLRRSAQGSWDSFLSGNNCFPGAREREGAKERKRGGWEALHTDSSRLSLAGIENGCTCPRTGIGKDGDGLMMEDERVDPIPAAYAVPGLQ